MMTKRENKKQNVKWWMANIGMLVAVSCHLLLISSHGIWYKYSTFQLLDIPLLYSLFDITIASHRTSISMVLWPFSDFARKIHSTYECSFSVLSTPRLLPFSASHFDACYLWTQCSFGIQIIMIVSYSIGI